MTSIPVTLKDGNGGPAYETSGTPDGLVLGKNLAPGAVLHKTVEGWAITHYHTGLAILRGRLRRDVLSTWNNRRLFTLDWTRRNESDFPQDVREATLEAREWLRRIK